MRMGKIATVRGQGKNPKTKKKFPHKGDKEKK